MDENLEKLRAAEERVGRLEYLLASAREISAIRARMLHDIRKEKKMEKTFYRNLIYFFERDKTSWGRVELVAKIKEIYIEALEDDTDVIIKAKAEGDLDGK